MKIIDHVMLDFMRFLVEFAKFMNEIAICEKHKIEYEIVKYEEEVDKNESFFTNEYIIRRQKKTN